MATDLRGIPIRPRAFDQRPPGMAVPGLCDAALTSMLSGRVLRRREAEVAHQLPRGIEPRDVAYLGHERDGTGELDTPERLDRFHHRGEPPRLHRRVQLGLQPSDPFGLLR